MSFHAKWVELTTKIKIIRFTVSFTELKKHGTPVLDREDSENEKQKSENEGTALCGIIFMTLTLSLYGCSKAGQEQKIEPDVNPDDTAITEAESGGDVICCEL